MHNDTRMPDANRLTIDIAARRRPARDAAPVRRVILVVLDGLRADAIPLFGLATLDRLARGGAATLAARTVAPSVTAAAMTSLFTGVEPTVHGMTSDRFRIPIPTGPVHPLPRMLASHGIPARAWLARIPRAYRGLASRLGPLLGFESVRFEGEGAPDILDTARGSLLHQHRGLFVFHWPDADRAGHADGFPSASYARAARTLDHTVEQLDELTGASADPDTLLVLLADHGGGGARRRDHDSEHERDRTIPVILAGGRVPRGPLAPGATLLDVPATILSALGVAQPDSYTGRPLVDLTPPRWMDTAASYTESVAWA